jgi:putative ABC transport system permease protein
MLFTKSLCRSYSLELYVARQDIKDIKDTPSVFSTKMSLKSFAMITNYFKLAWRNLFKNKTYSAINILGLAMGLASFILLLLYLNYELSYDKWDAELNKVYQVSLKSEGDVSSATPNPLASFLADKYANIEASTSLQASGDFEILIAANNKKIYQNGLVTVDSTFLAVFPYKLLEGDAATALNQPNAVIISQAVAQKLFGNANPMGKTIKFYNATEAVVTGILQKPKMPSHFDAEMVMVDPYLKQNKFWGNQSNSTYIKLKQPLEESKIEDAINRFYYNERLKEGNKTYEEYKQLGQKTALFVDAVPNIHNFPKHGSSNFSVVSILVILAILLLLAGSINFSNLAVAKSIGRAKEVGVRKVLGSNRKQLITQFMSEAGLQCLISLVLAGLIVLAILPYFKQSFNIQFDLLQKENALSIVSQIAVCLIIVTLFSGLYPSVFLSKFNTSKVLKGDYSSGATGIAFRNSLIVVQFMVSAFFIIATLVVSKQMQFMQSQEKGFSDSQVMRITATQKTREDGFATMRNTLLSISGVSSVAKSTKTPWGNEALLDTSTIGFKVEGKEHRMASIKLSTDYFKTLQIPIVKGRFFNEEINDQNTRTAIINETAAKNLNMDDPIGKNITFPFCDSVPMQIVGVVKDINVQGFEKAVQPVVYTIGNKACRYQSGGAILVKLSSNTTQSTISDIEQTWKTIEPDFPIRYSFLDENFQKLFTTYIRLQKIILFFASIAILISVMGLFALTAFFAKQRTKELGIRKVLGASVGSLATLLSKDFIRLVIFAFIITIPVAWWGMNKWLETFAYRTPLSGWLFASAGLIVLSIAVLTVSFQAVKAAVANPVKSLRTE